MWVNELESDTMRPQHPSRQQGESDDSEEEKPIKSQFSFNNFPSANPYAAPDSEEEDEKQPVNRANPLAGNSSFPSASLNMKVEEQPT